MITLDEYVHETGLPHVQFVKLDVDGHECKVLRGGQAFLTKHRPLIVMELAPYQLLEEGHTIDELIDIIHSIGYVMVTLRGQRQLPTSAQAIQRLVPHGSSLNILVKPG